MTDNVPETDPSTTDKLLTHKLAKQPMTLRLVMTASFTERVSTVMLLAISLLTDNVPLIEPSTTDKLRTQRSSMQSITDKFVIVALVITASVAVKSSTVML